MMQEVVIAGAARTPMGGFQGALSGATAADLGGAAIAAALADAGVAPALVDELLMGCVLPAGQGQAPARQAGFKAGLPKEVPATTLNKMCGSGMKAAMFACDALALVGRISSWRAVWNRCRTPPIFCPQCAAARGWGMRKRKITCSSTGLKMPMIGVG